MSEGRIQVVTDASVAGDARAVIRLNGIFYLPADISFRIEPLDSQINADADPGWPGGERKPVDSRVGEAGLELQMGPDVMEARLLAPGTPVRISIPSAALSEELRWPDLGPRKQRGRLPLPPTKQAGRSGEARSSSVEEGKPDITPDQRGSTASGRDTTRAETGDRTGAPQDHHVFTVQAHTRPRPSLAFPFAIGFFLATGLAAAAGLVFEAELVRYIQRLAKPEPVQKSSDIAMDVLGPHSTSSDTSPRGTPVAGVDRQGALLIADKFLQAKPPDREEARFWLERAIRLHLERKDIRWAFTQLGTLYTQRGGSAENYLRAKVLWEIAGAQGDPVALCFLGALYEHGLGVPVDRERAVKFYAQARQNGGCGGAATTLAPQPKR